MTILSYQFGNDYVKIVKEGKLYVVKNSKHNEDYIKFINYNLARDHYNKKLKEVMNVDQV